MTHCHQVLETYLKHSWS